MQINYSDMLQKSVTAELKKGETEFEFDFARTSLDLYSIKSFLKEFQDTPITNPLTIEFNLRDSWSSESNKTSFADELIKVPWPLHSKIAINLGNTCLNDSDAQYCLELFKKLPGTLELINLEENNITSETVEYALELISGKIEYSGVIGENGSSVQFSGEVIASYQDSLNPD